MTTRVETTRIDSEPDGVFDDLTTVTFEFVGDKLVTRTSVNEDLIGGMARTNVANFTYDGAGNRIGETHFADNGGTFLEFSHSIERTFDAAGRVVTEVQNSPDFDGDGVLGNDYATITNYLYDAAGHLTFKRSDNTAYGTQAPSDYVEETWDYDSAGRLLKHRLDDPITFDCEIIRTYHYKNGVLQNIKEQNDIRFGDERPRIDESFTYNKDGSLKTKTDWADWSENGWMQRVDTTYTWKAGYDAQKITFDREGDFKPEAIKLVENWYNADGKLTHTLTSHDPGGDGGPLAGGFNSRDLFVKTWDGDTLVAETRDYGIDGAIEYEFTSQLLVA